MYRATASLGQPAAGPSGRPETGNPRIHPRVFVAGSWVSIWNGERSLAFVRLLRRGRLLPLREWLLAFAFTACALVAPLGLRRLVRWHIARQYATYRRRFPGETVREWTPIPRNRT